MNIAPVDDMLIRQTLLATMTKDQTGALYLDGKEFKRVKKESACIGHFPVTEFRFSGVSHTHKFIPTNPNNFIKSYVTENYEGHKIERGVKTFVGWIVDTLA